MEKIISVIIPCYNVQKYLGQCLNSIVSQNYRHLEIICINDGSTDDTLSVLNFYAADDSRIIIIDQENQGLSETRNKGISIATGEYLMFVDSDDWVANDYFSSFLSKINEEVDLVAASYRREFSNQGIDRDLKINGLYPADYIQRRLIGLIDHELSDPSQADSIVTAWSKLYKRSIIVGNSISFKSTKEIGTEDLLFNLQYTQYCRYVYVTNQALYHYRKNNTSSLTSNYKKNLFDQWKKLYSYIKPYCNTSEKEKAFYNRVCLSMIGISLNEAGNKNGVFSKAKNLHTVLKDKLYIESFKKLDLNFFPIHWKVFFFLAKYRLSLLLIITAHLINKIINAK